MTPPYSVEPLNTATHDRTAFSCGSAALDRYLHERAQQEANRDVARVFILRAQQTPQTIIGYYTLSASAVETTRLPPAIAKKLPRYQLLPAILLGRLAIAVPYQGQHLGALLLAEALRRALRISEELGAMAILVDAKDERAAAWYACYGFRRFQDRPLTLFLPMAEVRKLGRE